MFAEVRVAHARADELEDRVIQRKWFAVVFVWIAVVWLLLVLLVVILDGFSLMSFDQSDTVILVLLGTRTAHAIAPAILVAKYLFGATNNGK